MRAAALSSGGELAIVGAEVGKERACRGFKCGSLL